MYIKPKPNKFFHTFRAKYAYEKHILQHTALNFTIRLRI